MAVLNGMSENFIDPVVVWARIDGVPKDSSEIEVGDDLVSLHHFLFESLNHLGKSGLVQEVDKWDE